MDFILTLSFQYGKISFFASESRCRHLPRPFLLSSFHAPPCLIFAARNTLNCQQSDPSCVMRVSSVSTCAENNMAKTQKKDPEEKQVKKEKEETPIKKDKEDGKKEEARPEYEELVQRISVIAKPLAGRKLTKRLYKTVKKGEFVRDRY